MFMILMGSTFWTAPYHSLTTRELKRYVLFVPPCISKKFKNSQPHIFENGLPSFDLPNIFKNQECLYTCCRVFIEQ